MKTIKHLIILSLFLLINNFIYSQSCQNADFSYGNFDLWDGYTGYCCGAAITTPGIVSGRHTIITQSIPDPQTNNTIMTMPPTGGGAYSVRLGNDNTGSEAERLKKTFLVTPDNRLFIYQYALVLEDPIGHSPQEKPKFEVKVYDQNNNIVNPYECGYYQVVAGPATDNWGQNGEVRYKDWSTVGLDLSAYMGTNITVEFTTQDCGQGGHFGYAYIDAACGFLDIKVIGYCEGVDSVTLIAPDGFSSYLWPTTGETTQSIVIPAPTVGDSVFVNVTNEAGCSSNILHIFEELPLPIATAGNDTTICVGTELNLWSAGAGSGGQYSWYENGQQISDLQYLQITPIQSTVYTAYVANSNGCYSQDSSATVNIIVNNDLYFKLPNDTTICSSTSLTFNCPVQNVNYSWSSSNGTIYPNSASITENIIQTTTYYLTITNGSCSYTDSVKVNVNGFSSYPDTNQLYYCSNSTSFSITGPYFCQSYNWSTGSNYSQISVNPNDTNNIFLEFINQFGCYDSTRYILNMQPSPVPVLDLTSDTVCMQASVNISVTNIGNNYFSWTSIPAGVSSSAPYINVSPSVSTTYIVQAISLNGCTDLTSYDTAYIHVDSSAYFVVDPSHTICENQSVPLTVNNPSGYLTWLLNGNVISNQSTIIASPPMTTYYYVTQLVGSCNYSNSVLVNVNQISKTYQNIDFCSSASSIQLQAPNGYTSYYWPTFLNSSNNNLLNNPIDNQQIPVYCTNYNTCVDTLIKVINIVQPSTISSLTNHSICEGDIVSLSVSSSGVNDFYTWTSNPVGYIAYGNSINVSPSTTTTYNVSLSNNSNCLGNPSTSHSTINVTNLQPINIIHPQNNCLGDVINFSVTNIADSYSWTYNGNNYTTNTLNISPLQSGTVTLTLTDGPCTYSQTASFQLNHTDYSISSSLNPIICVGDTLDLNISPNAFNTINWFESTNNIVNNTQSILVHPNNSTTYYAQVFDLNNCVDTTSLFAVTVNQKPNLNLGSDIFECEHNILVLQSNTISQSYIYSWSTNETSPSINVSNSGLYWLNITDNVCEITDSINVNFGPGSSIGIIPNVISPNNDNVNDIFEFQSDNLNDFEMTILNRWGEVVFKTDDPLNFWNGTLDNHPVVNGVYFYKIIYSFNCGDISKKEISGNITVLK